MSTQMQSTTVAAKALLPREVHAASPDTGQPIGAALRRNPIIRFFSSVRLGVTWLALVLIYACVMSAMPQVRGALEMTEMAAFGHWLFTALIVLLCTSLTLATITRIRWSIINAGVLTVHAGILLLCGGSVLYFGTKIEGDVLLRTPSIELFSTGAGQSRVVARLRTQPGESWSNTMPALGGEVKLDVTDVQRNGARVERATLRAAVGGGEPRTIDLRLTDPSPQPLNNRLALRLASDPPAERFYDKERAALYVRRNGERDWQEHELAGLPIFRERYLDQGYTLLDRSGKPSPSKRAAPEVRIGGLRIPTGWFERWRMPIPVDVADAPFDVSVTGYVPYVGGTSTRLIAGGERLNPGATIRLSNPKGDRLLERSLQALSPADSLLMTTPPIEFRWAATPAEREEILRPMIGVNELSVEVADPPVKKVIPIQVGQETAIEGTPYKIRVKDIFPSWPLMSPGFENAVSPAALIEVERGETRFTRTAIQRYPQMSQDIDAEGVRRRDALLDTNISLRFRTCADGWMTVVADPEGTQRGEALVASITPDARAQQIPVRVGVAAPIQFQGFALDFTLVSLSASVRAVEIPVVEPLETREANVSTRGVSAIRLNFTGRGSAAGWSEERWLQFSIYPEEDASVLAVEPPGAGVWELVYSRLAHPLGQKLWPGTLSVRFLPGRNRVDFWRSDFGVGEPGSDEIRPGMVQTNSTFTVGDWALFQSGAARDNWSYTILGVGNRRGIGPMVLGCCMITLGCLYAFYVKPALRRRALERALAAHAA